MEMESSELHACLQCILAGRKEEQSSFLDLWRQQLLLEEWKGGQGVPTLAKVSNGLSDAGKWIS